METIRLLCHGPDDKPEAVPGHPVDVGAIKLIYPNTAGGPMVRLEGPCVNVAVRDGVSYVLRCPKCGYGFRSASTGIVGTMHTFAAGGGTEISLRGLRIVPREQSRRR